VRAVLTAAVVYIAFLLTWGLNYRRAPLAQKLEFSPVGGETLEPVRELALTAAAQLNELYDRARGERLRIGDEPVDPSLADAFAAVQQTLGTRYPARPARPKLTLLDPYFRAAGVEGMTAPFFMETLVPSDILAVERPYVVLHEWSHLAGFGDEGEASFVAWLASVRGSPREQYSGWLALYGEAVNVLPARDREDVGRRLGAGPRDDLRAIAERRLRNLSPLVSAGGWRLYDQYLKANRVEAGIASYGGVLGLVLGTRFGPGWTPVLRRS
jgi:hypothetical protein